MRIAYATLRLVRTSANASITPQPLLRAWEILRAYDPTTVTWNQWQAGSDWTVAGCQGFGTDLASASYGHGVVDYALANEDTFIDITSLVDSYVSSNVPVLRIRIANDSGVGRENYPAKENATAAYRPVLYIIKEDGSGTVLSPTSDTYLDSNNATTNYDSATSLQIANTDPTINSGACGLFTFNLASLIPSVIQFATVNGS